MGDFPPQKASNSELFQISSFQISVFSTYDCPDQIISAWDSKRGGGGKNTKIFFFQEKDLDINLF